MTGIDTSQGKLVFPPRFVPYLEKHRIFEIFHELAELLVQEKPKDHIKFLATMLPCAARRRNKPRIVFLAPSTFDRVRFAEEVARRLGIACISRFYLEMKERERRMLERLQREEALRLPVPEDYSCVCPGEMELGEYEIPYPMPFLNEESESEKPSVVELYKKSTTVSEEDVEEEEDEDPCKGLRVCPCKDGHRPDDDGSAGSKATEKKSCRKTKTSGGSANEYDGEGAVNGDGQATVPSQESCVCESSDNIVLDFGVLGGCEYSEKGWVLIDLPEDAEEAELLCEQGALPTHAIQLITGEEEEKGREYKYLTKAWETVYRGVPLTKIHVNGRGIPKLADDVCKLLRVMPHRHAPMLPRVVLIGSRGSGTTTQAKLLSEKYGMVHVEFEEEMARVVLQDDTFSEMYKRQLMTRPDPELEAALLERILLSPKCRKRGWVLTGYPKNIDQLRMLDLVATPPNRVIFIEVPAKECFIRLYYRKTDWTDAKEYKLPVVEPFGVEGRDPVGLDPEVANRLASHPRNDKRQIIHDIEEYFEEKEEMMKYCGKTAAYVNGNKSADSVFELIDQIIIEPSPAEPPRDPLATSYGVEDAYERLKKMRMDSGITARNLMVNPPDPIFKF